jgi:alpha-L-arabinofuranosidase
MGVWAGYALGGTSVPENQLDPYIQEAVDQINFAIGDPAKSSAAALRASLGRSEPFKLLYVEIGNEVGPSPHVCMGCTLIVVVGLGWRGKSDLCVSMEAVCHQAEARVSSAQCVW